MKRDVILAVDLGAESGRIVAGLLADDRLELDEIHRFSNGPVEVASHLHWDAPQLLAEIKEGLAAAVSRHEGVRSVGIDTWGVDYGLLDEQGELLGLPFHYRDARTQGMPELAFERVPAKEIYATTGIQFMFFNTLWQLLAERQENPERLARAQRLLFMPDLLGHWLCGATANERTIASTSQLLEVESGEWATGLLERLDLPRHLLGPLVDPGTVLGPLLPAVANDAGATFDVVAPGGHDTACAVAAIPIEDEGHLYVSSGTWSLMGIESEVPLVSERSFEYGFTHERGAAGRLRILKNLAGLWPLQECRRQWASDGDDVDYETLAAEAEAAEPFVCQLDLDAPEFAAPGDMPARIMEYCQRTGQRVPGNRGEMVRSILESLALGYRTVAEQITDLTGQARSVLHIVGGGSQNRLLNRFAADATGLPVMAGPVEATSIGNILMQLVGLGMVADLAEGRELVRRSFPVETFEPGEGEPWARAHRTLRRFQEDA